MASKASLLTDQDCIDIAKLDSAGLEMLAAAPSGRDRKRSNLSILIDFWKLRLGAGRLSLNEYLELRLFDEQLYRGVDKKAFVGLQAARRIWFQANYRVDLFAMATNKIASTIWFAAHGLPVLPTVALYHQGVGRPNGRLLRDEAELRAFLKNAGNYPLFGKPIEGSRSIGSSSIECYVESNDSLVTTAGRLISLTDFVSFIKSNAAAGYLFQSRVSPHAAVREVCGDRLATVRLLTILKGGKPRVLRACWKIPGREQAADNFWRPGNLLAQLDLDSGRVTRLIRGSSNEYEEITHHPDSGVRILGMNVPNWHKVTELAMEGAKLLPELPLVGWDIAPVDAGAVLVEPNVTPDFQLHQLADRRGIVEPALTSFLQERKQNASTYLRAGRPRSKLSFLQDRAKEAADILGPNKSSRQPSC
jgi:hypothetical protein